MRKPFNPPTVKHDIQFIKTMEPNAQGEMVEKRIVRVSGPPLPGIETPYIDPSVPDVLKRYSLTDILNQPVKPVEKLWGNYWQTGQLCILAGDMGTGKSTLAIRLARAVAEGQPYLGQRENESESEEINTPPPPDAFGWGTHLPIAIGTTGESRLLSKRVLFIGFELGAAEMRMRYGEGEVPDNFFYANISADAFASGRATLGERLVASVEKMVEETEAEVLIIDQPDRMHLQPAIWNLLMLKLNALKVSRGVSVLITLNNKPRNLSKAPTISSIYKSNLLAPHADSIVCIANHCRAQGKRYIKLLKNTARPLEQNTAVEVLEIGLQKTTADDECQGSQKAKISLQPPTILAVQACGTEREEKVLLPTATERRNMRMIEAEEMRRQGMGFRDIAQRMELPERTVRSWVSFLGARDEGRGASESVCRQRSFLCLSKETNQRKDPTPKNTAILLSHKANHTNCHAKFCVHTGRGQPTALRRRILSPFGGSTAKRGGRSNNSPSLFRRRGRGMR